MSSPKTITLDPDGDLVLMLDPVEEVPKSEHKFQLVTSEEQSHTRTSDIAEPIVETVYKTHVVVSSKHMSLASPVFKAMLQGEFREGQELRGMKKINLPLPDDDAEAMKILVHLIHCKLKSVPLEVNLELFTNIAILVDKYRTHEVLSIMAPIWKKHLDTDITKTFSAAARWICIAWGSTNVVKAKIEDARQKAASEGIQLFSNLLEKYMGDQLICTSSGIMSPYLDDRQTHRRLCDSMVLGCLMKGYKLLGIFPQEPYTNFSILECHTMAQRLAVTTACFTTTRRVKDNHGICEDLIENLRKIDAAAQGLSLKDLKRKDKHVMNRKA
ncbi:BTB POZ domain-containing protein [Rutstroemia sp. NJR-2017a BBW]|nr:BTB POZ domain-containing protein [Rutstroemia sp. NJR-2017a BBW]